MKRTPESMTACAVAAYQRCHSEAMGESDPARREYLLSKAEEAATRIKSSLPQRASEWELPE